MVGHNKALGGSEDTTSALLMTALIPANAFPMPDFAEDSFLLN